MRATLLRLGCTRLLNLLRGVRLRRKSAGADGGKPGLDLVYRDYRLFVVRRGAGWRVYIHAPGAFLASGAIPSTNEPGGRNRVIAEAKAIVDQILSG